MIRLRELFQRGGAAMRKVKEGTAGMHELEELKSVRLGLTNEFNSYPSDLQDKVRPAYTKINEALGVVINKLQMKLSKGTEQVEEIEGQRTALSTAQHSTPPMRGVGANSRLVRSHLRSATLSFAASSCLCTALPLFPLCSAESTLDSSADIADDLLQLLTTVAAADLGVELPHDSAASQFETSGRRGGWSLHTRPCNVPRPLLCLRSARLRVHCASAPLPRAPMRRV